MNSPSDEYRIHLVDQCKVVSFGEEVRVWFLKENDAWVRAKDHPNAELETANSERDDDRCPAGFVWVRSVELRLKKDTILLCRTSSPLAQQGEMLDFLTRGASRSRRRVSEQFYQVKGNYRTVALRNEIGKLRDESSR